MCPVSPCPSGPPMATSPVRRPGSHVSAKRKVLKILKIKTFINKNIWTD